MASKAKASKKVVVASDASDTETANPVSDTETKTKTKTSKGKAKVVVPDSATESESEPEINISEMSNKTKKKVVVPPTIKDSEDEGEAAKPDKLTSATTIENTGDTDDDNESNGKWTNRFMRNPAEAKLIMDFLDVMKNKYEGFDGEQLNELWNLVCHKSRDEMTKLYKKSKKREEKQKVKFQPSGLEKPPRSGRDIFIKELANKNKAAGIKMNIKEQSEAWTAVSEANKEKYRVKAEELKQKFQDAVAKQKKEAIAKGEFAEDRPKKYMTAYFLFRNDELPKLKTKYTIDPASLAGKTEEEVKAIKLANKEKIDQALKTAWDNINPTVKGKYESQVAKDKAKYEKAIAEWKEKEEKRQAAQKPATASA